VNLTTACGWGLLRSAAVGLFAAALAGPLCGLIANARKTERRAAWVLLLVPYLTPVVLVGYAWSNFSLSLVHHPTRNELLYALLLVVKLAPVAVLVDYLAPSYLSREAMHCRRLLRHGTPERRPLRESLSFFIHGSTRKTCVAFAVVFLFAFADFELASLLNIRTWTVLLFDAQAGGLALPASLRLAALPLACETAILLLVIAMLFGSRGVPSLAREHPKPPGRAGRCLRWGYLLSALALATVVPAVVVLRGTLSGFRVIAENPALGKDIGTSILFAACAGGVSYVAAGWFSTRAGMAARAKARLLLAFLLSLPGLLGALLLALLVLSLFQLTALRTAYDTPLPLFIALTLLLFPFAVLLRVLLHVFRGGEGLHAARLLGRSCEPRVRRSARGLIWDMRTRGHFLVAALLFLWGYFDVVTPSLLAPSAMTPVFVRLYNLMHYGQIAGLSAMVLAAALVPLLLFGLAASARRLFTRLANHG
jgi:ABC-type Fe3+ transport system permease subunit